MLDKFISAMLAERKETDCVQSAGLANERYLVLFKINIKQNVFC